MLRIQESYDKEYIATDNNVNFYFTRVAVEKTGENMLHLIFSNGDICIGSINVDKREINNQCGINLNPVVFD